MRKCISITISLHFPPDVNLFILKYLSSSVYPTLHGIITMIYQLVNLLSNLLTAECFAGKYKIPSSNMLTICIFYDHKEKIQDLTTNLCFVAF